MNQNLITLEGVSKHFREGTSQSTILNNVDLTIDDGELIAIEGPSGSGKSTLLSILGLLDDVSSGTHMLRNERVSGLTRKQKALLRNQHIGWVFQNFNLINSLTAIENVSLALRFNNRISARDYHQLAYDALCKVGLQDKVNTKPDKLSGGQQQRVAIARALVCSPSLLLADEPTGNLDSETGRQIMALLLELSETGVTIVIVTHDEKVAQQCSRRIHILDGRVSDAHE